MSQVNAPLVLYEPHKSNLGRPRRRDTLKSPDVLDIQPIRRPAEMSGQLRNRADVGSLCRGRKITDWHVFDHAATKRAQLGHLETPV